MPWRNFFSVLTGVNYIKIIRLVCLQNNFNFCNFFLIFSNSIFLYIENDPYCAFLSTPTCSVGSDVLNSALNGWPGVTGRHGQKGAVGIIFDMAILNIKPQYSPIIFFNNFLFNKAKI